MDMGYLRSQTTTSGDQLKCAVVMLEVELWGPVYGLVLADRARSAVGCHELINVRVETEICNSVRLSTTSLWAWSTY